MIKVENLCKSFDKVKALNNISISTEKGKIFGLVGSNGCGKTTLLKHISGIYVQDSGIINYDNQIINKNSELSQDMYFIQDNIYFPRNYSLLRLFEYEKLFYKNISKERFDKLVKFFALDPKKMLNKMSKGQKKQAAFVMAMTTCPKVLLLDEIVDGLDAVIRRKFWDVLIEDILENETTVIISSHDLKELDNICDRVAIMHEGEIIKEEELEKLKEETKRVQFAVEGEFSMPKEQSYSIIKNIKIGSVNICTIKGDLEEFKKYLYSNYSVLIFDVLAINLEEIFIAELREKNYGAEEFEGFEDEKLESSDEKLQ